MTTLPTRPSAVRLRIWRALKALGSAALRDGAYLLPAAQAPALDALADEVRRHGDSASVLALAPRDEAQRAEILALFDRSADYARWHEQAHALRDALDALAESDAQRRLRAVAEALQALQLTEHYPGTAAEQAEVKLAELRLALQQRYSRGEPSSRRAHGVTRLDARKFQVDAGRRVRDRWSTGWPAPG